MKKSVKECFPKKVRKVMHEYKVHKLVTSVGKKITKRKQATAIALSEAKKKC